MKVLMTTAHATLLDGVNRHIQVLAPAIARIPNVELRVVVCLERGELNDALEKNGVNACAIGMKSIRSLVGLVRLIKLLLTFRPDIVHSEMPMLIVNSAVALVRMLGLKIKFVTTIHGAGSPVHHQNARAPRLRLFPSYGKVRHALHDFANRHISGIIYVSKGVMAAHPRQKCVERTIYNPMDFVHSMSEPSGNVLHTALQVPNDTPLIGTACRITEVKRPDCFLRVMIGALSRHPTAHGVVMGDGNKELMRTIRKLAFESPCGNRLHILGYCPNAKEMITSLSCFIMTSYCEGMPTALLEAMSQHVPVAFWKGGGGLQDLAEMNEKEGPLAVVREQDDIDGLAQGICELLNDPKSAKQVAERAYEVGKRVFDLDAIAQQTIEFYEEVVGKRLREEVEVEGKCQRLREEVEGEGQRSKG